MAIDLNKIKNRLNSLTQTNQRANVQWKPSPGTQQVRIVPYKFNPDNPFIELHFHYNINNRTYLSPSSFGRPDPIVEFAEKLKKTGDQDDYRMGRSLMPKMRTFVPVIVRGEENEGVKFWGFGKEVYQELLSFIADPDYGDITDPKEGRDITIEFLTAEEANRTYPKTNIRVKPNKSVVSTDKNVIKLIGESQKEITSVYEELSYDDLKEVLEKWINGEEEGGNTEESSESSSEGSSEPSDQPESASKETTDTVKDPEDVAAAFEDLFKN